MQPQLLKIRVDKLVRHDRAQRPASPKKWIKKIVRWDEDKVGYLRVCSDGNGKFWVIDGAHRAEYAANAFGPAHQLWCIVEPGTPTVQQIAEWFLSENRDVLSMGVESMHNVALVAGEPLARFIEDQRTRLQNSRVLSGLYTIARQYDRNMLIQTIYSAIKLWGPQAEVPGVVLAGIALYRSRFKEDKLYRPINRKREPALLLSKAVTQKARHGGFPQPTDPRGHYLASR